MRISKKILACVLAALMAISMMPLTVFAASATQTEDSVAYITVNSVKTYYDSIEEAVAACPDNASSTTKVYLIKDTTITHTINITNGKNVQLYYSGSGANKVISGAIDPMFHIENGKLDVKYVDVTVTANDCTAFRMKGAKDAGYKYSYLRIQGNVTSNEYGVFVQNNNGYADGVYVEINKTNMVCGLSCVYINGNVQKYGTTPAYVTTSSSSAVLTTEYNSGNSSHDNAAIYAAGYAKWNFTTYAPTITGPTAIYAKCGQFTIESGTYTGNGDAVEYSHNGNGLIATGDAFVVENCAGYCKDFNISIKGGTFNSVNAEPLASYAYSKGADTRERVTGFVEYGVFTKNGVETDIDEFIVEGGGYYTIPDGSGAKTIYTPNTVAVYENSNGAWVPSNGVMNALGSAATNTTVYVIKDVDNDTWTGMAFSTGYQPSISRNVVLDLQGYNVTTNKGSETATTITPSIKVNGGSLRITSSTPATLTAAYGISVNSKSGNTLIIDEKVTVKSTNGTYTTFIDSTAKNSTVTINGTVENAGKVGTALYVNGSVADATNTITVNGSAIGQTAGIYAAGKGTYNINGTVTGDTGIYAKQGTVNVATDAVVKGTGSKNDYTANGSGFVSTGDGIAADKMLSTIPAVNVAAGATLESNYNNAYKEYPTEDGEVFTVDPAAIIIEHNYTDEYSITNNDNVDLNIYVDNNDADVNKVVITYSDPTKDDGSTIEETKPVSSLPEENDHRIVKVELAPAQINDTITVAVLDENNEVIRTIETSVADYCNTIINMTDEQLEALDPVKGSELKDLAKSTLDYGKAASEYFDYNTDADWTSSDLEEPDLEAIEVPAGSNWYDTSLFTLSGVSYVATTVPELRFEFKRDGAHTDDYYEALNSTLTVNFAGASAKFVKKEDGTRVLKVTGIDITKFGDQLVVKSNGSDILQFVPISWAKSAAKSTTNDELAKLGKSICNYYLKSVAYFG